jgi:hypothetical protein
LSKDTELKRQEAQFDLKFGTLQITYDSLKKQNEEINKVKDEEIKELRKIVEKQNKPDYTAAWFGGGIGLGVVLTVVLYFVIQEVKK